MIGTIMMSETMTEEKMFDKDTKQIEENLTIKNLTRQDTLKLTNEEVGPLRLAATKDKKPQK